MADSFCLIRSNTEPSASVVCEENAALKAKLEEMQQQLSSAEHMLKMRHDQDQQLRDSIILARKEVCLFIDRIVFKLAHLPRRIELWCPLP